MAALGVHPSQNSAPVLEFRCLYTSDLRRKQKRWQDGRVKYHTFNKRVMVYDESSNFVGDTHWRDDDEFNEGQELELERGGLLVQVSERVGIKDQDLSELLKKRVREREEMSHASSCKIIANKCPEGTLASTQQSTKSLASILGSRSMRFGRTLPMTVSPHDQRQLVRDDGGVRDTPVLKRRKLGSPPKKRGYAQNLTGAALTLVSRRPGTVNVPLDRLPFTASRIQNPEESLCKARGQDQLVNITALAPTSIQIDHRKHKNIIQGNPDNGSQDLCQKTSDKDLASGIGRTKKTQACASSNCRTSPEGSTKRRKSNSNRNAEIDPFTNDFDSRNLDIRCSLSPTCSNGRLRKAGSTDGAPQSALPIIALRIKSRPKNKMLHVSERSTLRRKSASSNLPLVASHPTSFMNDEASQATERLDVLSDIQSQSTRQDCVDVRNTSISDEEDHPYDCDIEIDYETIDSILMRKESINSAEYHKSSGNHEYSAPLVEHIKDTSTVQLEAQREGSTFQVQDNSQTSCVISRQNLISTENNAEIQRQGDMSMPQFWPNDTLDREGFGVTITDLLRPTDQIPSREATESISNDTEGSRSRVRSYQQLGPWTRESYDLFGDWRSKTSCTDSS